jgi:hypothetical protein
MLKFTQGSPDEMQLWIACGIALYLTVFPLVVIGAAVFGMLLRHSAADGLNAAETPGENSGPTHQRGAVASVLPTSEPSLGTAA